MISRPGLFSKATGNFCARRIKTACACESKATNPTMKLTQRIKEAGAAGYILLWLLGIPLPILFVIFLLRGCT